MARRFLRTVRVTVGDADSAVKVDSLYIRAHIRREASATPVSGEIEIYNLSQDNERLVRNRGVGCRLAAGYAGEVDEIYSGKVRRVERKRRGLDRVTIVRVGGDTLVTPMAEPANSSFSGRTFEGVITVRELVAEGARSLGLIPGPLTLIPADAVEEDFSYNTGQTETMLYGRLHPLGLEWYQDNGVLRISRPGRTNDDRPIGIVVSEDSGMIGTPSVTEDGLRVRTLLNPLLRLDTRVQVRSRILGEIASGTWKVVEEEHQLDNREGPFFTEVGLRPLG